MNTFAKPFHRNSHQQGTISSDAIQTKQLPATSPGTEPVRQTLPESLNQSPQVQTQLQLQHILNQNPGVMIQAKLAQRLSNRTNPVFSPLHHSQPSTTETEKTPIEKQATTRSVTQLATDRPIQFGRRNQGYQSGKKDLKWQRQQVKYQQKQALRNQKFIEEQAQRPPRIRGGSQGSSGNPLIGILLLMMVAGAYGAGVANNITTGSTSGSGSGNGTHEDDQFDHTPIGRNVTSPTLVPEIYPNSTLVEEPLFSPFGRVSPFQSLANLTGTMAPQPDNSRALMSWQPPLTFDQSPSLLETDEFAPFNLTTGRGFGELRANQTQLGLTNLTSNGTNTHRVSPQIQELLVSGVKMARNPSESGQKGLLNPRQALRAAESLTKLPKDQYQTVKGLLSKTGRIQGTKLTPEDRAVQKMLILKSLAARQTSLLSGNDTDATQALQEITEYAKSIRSLNKENLIESASIYDVNSDVNSCELNPVSLDTADFTPDEQTTNDGYFQHYVTTCGPSSLLIALADEDPVLAQNLKQSFTGPLSNHTVAESAERRVWNQFRGNVDDSLAISSLKPRLADGYYQKITAWIESHAAADPGKDELLAFLETPSQKTLGDSGNELLEKIRGANTGFPNQTQIDVIRTYPVKSQGLGIGGAESLKIGMERAVTPVSGVKYKIIPPPNEKDHPQALKSQKVREKLLKSGILHTLDPVIEALKQGETVMCSIVKPDHQMSMVDIRGTPGSYEFQVHDPWLGKTVWVGQKALLDATFVRDDLEYDTYSADTRLSDFHIPE